MDYTELKNRMRERLGDLIYQRSGLSLREQTTDYTNFEYAKLTGQIIAMYEAIIMVQEMEIEKLADKEVEKDV